MKQRITKEQLLSLTDEQKEKLRELWKPSAHDVVYNTKEGYIQVAIEIANKNPINEFLPLLTIGDMIEILENKGIEWEEKLFYPLENQWVMKEYDGELCDALFEVLKEVL